MDAAPRASDAESFWTDTRLRLGLCGAVAVVFFGGLYLRFNYGLDLPAKPPPPPEPTQASLRDLDYEVELFSGYLLQDARRFGLAPTRPEDLDRLFPYEDVTTPQPLSPSARPIETRMLRLSTRVEEGQLILRIDNKGEKPVAYAVATATGRDPALCRKKDIRTHNAIAIPAQGFVERTECAYAKDMSFRVLRIEAIEIPPLSFFYVSRLEPTKIGLDERTSVGHAFVGAEKCSLPGANLDIDLGKQLTTWRDIIDFYARHPCEHYRWLRGYRAWTRDKQFALPVLPLAIRPGP